LKSLFQSVISDDLINHNAKKLVEETNASLNGLGHKTQVHARDINFFYLDAGVRGRLEKSKNGFIVVDSDLRFTNNEIGHLIKSEPEKFSPNVVLRPVYQELILPNLSYIGGPAEVVYWFQLKSVFDFYKIPYPIVLPRNFALVVDAPTSRKFKKTGLAIDEVFLPKDDLHKHYVNKFTRNKIKLNGEKEAIEKYFESIREHAESFDKTLGPLVGAETRRAIKSLEKIEQKLLRDEKRNKSDKLSQVDAVKDTLFPGGSPQERKDNFLNFYHKDKQFIGMLIDRFDPLDFRFNVLMYND
jgi:bacillithiol biosynthesis cysteine-adding enzyme BshC